MGENYWKRAKIEDFLADKKKRKSVDDAMLFFDNTQKALLEAERNFGILMQNTRNRVSEYASATSSMNIEKIEELMKSFEEDKKNLEASFDTTINGFVEVAEGKTEEQIKTESESKFKISKVR